MTNSLTIGLFTSNKMRTIHSLLLCYKYTSAACFVFYVIKIENNNRIS